MVFNVKKERWKALTSSRQHSFFNEESIIDRRIDQPIVARPGLQDAL